MTEHPDLFSEPPQEDADYKVPGLQAHGDQHLGDWLQVWADAGHRLESLQDRQGVMLERGLDPRDFIIHQPKIFNRTPTGWRTFWFCWPKHLPSPAVHAA